MGAGGAGVTPRDREPAAGSALESTAGAVEGRPAGVAWPLTLAGLVVVLALAAVTRLLDKNVPACSRARRSRTSAPPSSIRCTR
ncbi:hypothetical protein [Planotetraspora phitsanulokensis]|uniref:hypothetical protein n=1 Tax=Planotetraspora phitsanulokensis TaxID=575192 RepID=UPI001EF3AADD|nr:hypothetical protein [Planotetraspora phitsanulokensis]